MTNSKNNASRRPVAYWSFFLTFLLGGGPILAIGRNAPDFVHPALDGIALLLAMTAVALLFDAYHKTKAPVIGILAFGTVGAAVLQALHVFADSPLLEGTRIAPPEVFMPWTWNAMQLWLALVMLTAACFANKDAFGKTASSARQRIAVKMTLALTAVAVPTASWLLLRTDLPPLIIEARAFSRPSDLAAGLVFTAGIIVFALKGNWRKDSYGHMFLMAMIAGQCSQIFLMAFSKQLFDASFTAAHLLQLAMYACLIAGFGRPQQVSSSRGVADEIGPQGLNMGAKLAILCGLIAMISVMPLAFKSSSTLHQFAAENGIRSLSTAAETAGMALAKQRLDVNSDLSYMANAAPLSKLADPAKRRPSLNELQRMVSNLRLSDSSYLSVRYVDAASVQTLASSNTPDFEALAEFTERQANALIAQALKSDAQANVMRSNLERLDTENGSLRVEATAMVVYNAETDLPRGVFIIQSDVSKELTSASRLEFDTSLFVIDASGRFVVHPDRSKEADVNTDYTIADEFPGVNFVELAGAESAGGAIYADTEGTELILGASVLPASFGASERLLYVFTGTRDDIEKDATVIGNEMQQTAQLALLCAVVLGWFLARRLARPVRDISAAALEFGRTGSIGNMPVDGRDEIGMLAKSLNDMMTEVNHQRENLVLLAAAVESSVDSIIISDSKGRIVYANPQYEHYAGVKSEDILGLRSNELPEFQDYKNVLSEAPAKRGKEMVWSGQYQWRRADGRMHDESITISPIRDANDEIVNHAMIIQDITERRQMEKEIEAKAAELLRSNKDLEQFAYVASHDLKAPLRAIEVILEWLREDLEDFDEGDVQENLDLLGQRTNRLGRLLEDLLAYSRAGRKVGDVRQLEMKPFVEDIAALIAPPAGMQIIADDSLPTIVAHHAPLETVLRNLMSNAIKHHPDPATGVIRISATEQEDSVTFSVEDNGNGIPDEYAGKVFKMFQTLKPRDDCEGSGMGLAIVQRIITWQGGRIWFTNKPDGSGIVFKFIWQKRPQDMPEIEEEDEDTSDDVQMAG